MTTLTASFLKRRFSLREEAERQATGKEERPGDSSCPCTFAVGFNYAHVTTYAVGAVTANRASCCLKTVHFCLPLPRLIFLVLHPNRFLRLKAFFALELSADTSRCWTVVKCSVAKIKRKLLGGVCKVESLSGRSPGRRSHVGA